MFLAGVPRTFFTRFIVQTVFKFRTAPLTHRGRCLLPGPCLQAHRGAGVRRGPLPAHARLRGPQVGGHHPVAAERLEGREIRLSRVAAAHHAGAGPPRIAAPGRWQDSIARALEAYSDRRRHRGPSAVSARLLDLPWLPFLFKDADTLS